MRVWSERARWVAVELHFPFPFLGSECRLPPLCSRSPPLLLYFSSHPISPPSSRRGVSALRLPPPLPRSLPPPGAAGSLRAAAPQEDVAPGVSAATLATSAAAGSAERRGGVRGPSGARGAAVRHREGDRPGHVGARLQEL